MKHDYTALDAAIIATLETEGPLLSYGLFYGDVFIECKRAAASWSKSAGTAGWGVLHMRLQALRKAGKISYSRKPEGWSLVKEGGA